VIGAAEQAIQLIAPDSPLSVLLRAIVECATAVDGTNSEIVSRTLDYADFLWRESAWPLAADAYRTVTRNASRPHELALVPRAHRYLGTCLRMQGDLAEALTEYALGQQAAQRCADLEAELRLQIAVANVYIHQTQYDRADGLLQEVLSASESSGLRQVHARALHDRGVVAFQRDEIGRAVALFNEALHEYEDETLRERAMADLAVAMVAVGAHDTAREAFKLIHAHSPDYGLRAMAAINLMELAYLEGDEAAFHAYRRQLAGIRLSGLHAASCYLRVGKGYRRFGNEVAARAAFKRAEIIARRAKVGEVLAELNALNGERVSPPTVDAELIRSAATTLASFAHLSTRGGQRNE
jgi:tetratricopeptide (TPR) repeat protein